MADPRCSARPKWFFRSLLGKPRSIYGKLLDFLDETFDIGTMVELVKLVGGTLSAVLRERFQPSLNVALKSSHSPHPASKQ
jgi:hypothetical protein